MEDNTKKDESVVTKTTKRTTSKPKRTIDDVSLNERVAIDNLYKRTGKLGKSVKSHGVSKLNSRVDFYIWLDRTYNYTVPNPDFIERGFSSFFSTPMVFEKAEAGEANIKGKPGFWKRSKEKIEIDLNSTLAKHFKHK